MAKAKENSNKTEKPARVKKGDLIPPLGGINDTSKSEVIYIDTTPTSDELLTKLTEEQKAEMKSFIVGDKGISSKDNPELTVLIAKAPTTKKSRKGYIIAVGHNQEVILLRSPKDEEISRRLGWRFPANFQQSVEAGQVYEVEAILYNQKKMDFLTSVLEIISVVELIPTA